MQLHNSWPWTVVYQMNMKLLQIAKKCIYCWRCSRFKACCPIYFTLIYTISDNFLFFTYLLKCGQTLYRHNFEVFFSVVELILNVCLTSEWPVIKCKVWLVLFSETMLTSLFPCWDHSVLRVLIKSVFGCWYEIIVSTKFH